MRSEQAFKGGISHSKCGASDLDRFLAGRSSMKDRKAAGAGDIDKILARFDAHLLRSVAQMPNEAGSNAISR